MTPKMTKHELPLRFDRPFRIRCEVLKKLKCELMRLANSDKPEVIRFVGRMLEDYPQLRSL